MRRGDEGQAVPLVAVAVLVAVLGLLVIGRVGRLAVDRAGARTAADAAALAGAAAGRDAAEEVASRNDAQLWAFVDDGRDVEVTVQHGDARATARARRSGAPG